MHSDAGSGPESQAAASTREWHDFSVTAAAAACPAWREYCDRLHANLIAEWCGQRAFRRALKTDVFDEAVGAGCLPALADVADEVHGVDVSSHLVEQVSARRTGFQVAQGDVRRLDYPDAWCDLICSNSTLDHFASRQEIVASISGFYRVLEPGGLLAITLDNPTNPLVRCRNMLPQRALAAAGLVPYFMGQTLSMRELMDVLGGAGFRVLKTRHLMHAPRVVCLHLLRAIGRFPRMSRRLLGVMLAAEAAARLPTASLSGHYSAVLAEKPLRSQPSASRIAATNG